MGRRLLFFRAFNQPLVALSNAEHDAPRVFIAQGHRGGARFLSTFSPTPDVYSVRHNRPLLHQTREWWSQRVNANAGKWFPPR